MFRYDSFSFFVPSDWTPSTYIVMPLTKGHNREPPTQARSGPSSPQLMTLSEDRTKQIKITRANILFDDPRVMYEDLSMSRYLQLLSFDRSSERTITAHYWTTPEANRASPSGIHQSLGSSSDTLFHAQTILAKARTPLQWP